MENMQRQNLKGTATWGVSFLSITLYALGMFILLAVWADVARCAEKPLRTTSAPAPAANIPPTGSIQKSADTLHFMALVDVGERLPITLLPGETVEKCYCKKGDSIKKGQPVLQLNNDAIANGIADLILKKNKLKEEHQHLQLAQLEKRQKEKHLQRIVAKISKEKSLKDQIPNYTSPILSQLEMQRQTLHDQLEASTLQIAALQEGDSDNALLLTMIKSQLKDLQFRQAELLVKAPFNGKVFYVNPELNRIPPGGLVCELRNDTFFLAHGKIIQHQLQLVHVGDTVKVTQDLATNDVVEGKVQSINYVENHNNVQSYPSFAIAIRIDAHAHWLRPGIMVSVSK
jgi:multidrug efflux pump subunit AcrA (membrane-fusion protein)